MTTLKNLGENVDCFEDYHN